MKATTVNTLFAIGLLVLACKGPEGPAGPSGVAGERGPAGEPGAPGSPGTQVEVIPICPEHYAPFPEVLVRIGDSLLAVYSDGPKIHNTIVLFNIPMRTTDGRNVDFLVTPEFVVECL